jgi:hypothetical protein
MSECRDVRTANAPPRVHTARRPGRHPAQLPADLKAVVTVPVLMSVATVSRLLDCSPRTVRRRIAEGSLRAVTDHSRVMVRGDDLRCYVDGLKRIERRAERPRRVSPRARFDWLRDQT